MKKIQELRLISPIPPSVNHYISTRSIIKHGKPMSIPYVTAVAKKYKKDFGIYVKSEAKAQGWIMNDDKFQRYYVDTYYYFQRIDQDPNNYYKCMLDSITNAKCVWIDDNVVCERVQYLGYSIDNPRVELIIKPVEFVGIFANQSEYDTFETKCNLCSRYKRNCSLLKKSKIGFEQPEIKNKICSKFKKQVKL